MGTEQRLQGPIMSGLTEPQLLQCFSSSGLIPSYCIFRER
ncbi:hypothetical protein V6Z12_D03G053500 [Gossypium hirsutum]